MSSYTLFSLWYTFIIELRHILLLCWPLVYDKILIQLINIFTMVYLRSLKFHRYQTCAICSHLALENQMYFGYWELRSRNQLFQFLSDGVIVFPFIYYCLSLEDYFYLKNSIEAQGYTLVVQFLHSSHISAILVVFLLLMACLIYLSIMLSYFGHVFDARSMPIFIVTSASR